MYKVVIVEDELIIREGLKASIDWTKYNCEVLGGAKNGKEGLKVIADLKPDIIIVDVNMPIMDGLSMIAALPQNMYSFIIVSGHSEFEYAKKAIGLNVSDYLLKPLNHEQFENALLQAIEDLEMRRFFMNKESDDNHDFVIIDLDRRVDSISLTLITDYIKEFYQEKISMDDLCEVGSKSTTSINNRFQKHLDMTFNEYLSRVRIQMAIKEIETLSLHLYEVAERCGFNDYKYFTQVFKKYVGVSPKIVETYFLRRSNNQ